MKVDNAVIMAAGTSSRFAPLSYEKHKALTVVRGEVLIERQIRQLIEAGVPRICIVTGYKADQFEYLVSRYPVELIHNPDYLIRNNHSSIWAARGILGNTYICSSDNYFAENPFQEEEEGACYAAQYARGSTKEWCMEEDPDGFIRHVSIGGEKAWYMLGHAFWSSDFTERFLSLLEEEYDLPETADKLWESVYMEHLDQLKMKIRKFPSGMIYEFDTLDELREFDSSYWEDTRSKLIKKAASVLGISEKEIIHLTALKGLGNEAEGFAFDCPVGHYHFDYRSGQLKSIE